MDRIQTIEAIEALEEATKLGFITYDITVDIKVTNETYGYRLDLDNASWYCRGLLDHSNKVNKEVDAVKQLVEKESNNIKDRNGFYCGFDEDDI